jgi:hypothetical protein
MGWLWRLGVRSNEQAVVNARRATTALSRLRVERDDVELYLRHRYADRRTPVTSPSAGAPRAEAAR